MGRLEYITQPFITTYRTPSSPDVGEGVLTLPLAVRRETAVRMGCLYNPRFRKPPPKGGRGRPPLQPDWDGCEIYAAERIRIVTSDMLRGGYRYTYVFLRPTEGSSRTPTPTGGWGTDVSAAIFPPPVFHLHTRKLSKLSGLRSRVRFWVGVTARPYIMHPPTTSKKPPGFVTERLLSSIAYVRNALSPGTAWRWSSSVAMNQSSVESRSG